MAGFEHATYSIRTAVTLDICNIQDTSSADLNSERQRQIQEKEKKRRLSNWMLSFGRKI